MQLTLSESLYAYDLLHKQGKLLISEMESEDISGEDRSILKKFGYQYYYYYLFHYFNNLRNGNPSRRNPLDPSRLQTEYEEFVRANEEDRKAEMNEYHAILMESVNLVKFYDVIPRDSALAPVKLVINIAGVEARTERPLDFVFTWNMFDSEKSMEIFAKILCKDHGRPYDRRVVTEFEKQIIESSIIECDFAMLIEMLAVTWKITWNFHQRFRKRFRVDLTPERRTDKVYETVTWDLLNSDWEIAELLRGMLQDHGLDREQVGRVIYSFKRDLLWKKKECVRKHAERLMRYSRENNLRAPFISRDFREDLRDDRPFLLCQRLKYPPEMKKMFKSSYKERLQLLSTVAAHLGMGCKSSDVSVGQKY